MLFPFNFLQAQGPTIDPDAAAFFARVTAAGGTLSATEQTAVNTLVVQMKADGTWTPMLAIYPMVGASAAACAQNLKSSSFTGSFTSGWTFASTGVTPNGTSAYMSTGLVPSSVLSSQDSQHYSMYSRTNIAESRYGFGSNDVRFALKWGDSILYAKLGTLELAYGTNSTSLGLHLMSRTNSTNLPVFVRNTKINLASVSSSLSGLDILLGARQLGASVDSYGIRQLAFASIGDGLTDTQASDFYTAVQAFQTTLSRQV